MKEAKMVGPPKLNLYPLSYYTFFSKEPKMEKDASFDDRLVRSNVREVHVYWDEIDGLKRKLGSTFGGTTPLPAQDWQIGECVAVWWRPNFDTVMYPYCPPNIANPKECKKLYVVHLPDSEYFFYPKKPEVGSCSTL